MRFSPEDEVLESGSSSGVLRGLVIGTIAVAAIAIWAINLEALFSSDQTNVLWLIARVFVCEAIPLAALVALHRSIARKTSIDVILLEALASSFFFLTWRRSSDTLPQADEF